MNTETNELKDIINTKIKNNRSKIDELDTELAFIELSLEQYGEFYSENDLRSCLGSLDKFASNLNNL